MTFIPTKPQSEKTDKGDIYTVLEWLMDPESLKCEYYYVVLLPKGKGLLPLFTLCRALETVVSKRTQQVRLQFAQPGIYLQPLSRQICI